MSRTLKWGKQSRFLFLVKFMQPSIRPSTSSPGLADTTAASCLKQRTNVFDELESDWQKLCGIVLVFFQFGSIFHTAMRWGPHWRSATWRESFTSLSAHSARWLSDSCRSAPHCSHDPSLNSVYTFQAEGRLFIQEFAVKTAKRHGPRKKKGGSHIEKEPTCFFITRRSKEPNVVEAVKMKGSQEVWRRWQWTHEPEAFMMHQNHSSETQTWKAAAKCKSRQLEWSFENRLPKAYLKIWVSCCENNIIRLTVL